MTQKAALCLSLLRGEVLSIMVGFQRLAISNVPREIGRSVERSFNVEVSRTPVKFTSRYGHKGEYYNYRLNKAKYNLPGIKSMAAYIVKSIGTPKTQEESKIIHQLQPLLK